MTHHFVVPETSHVEETAGIRIERIAKQKGLAQGVKLAEALGVSFETLRKWRLGDTAPNRARQTLIEAYLKEPPAVFMQGVGDSLTQLEGPSQPAEAQTVSLPGRKVSPHVILWERLMDGRLLPEFETVMPDASMAPRINKGERIGFVTGGPPPEPGHLVLINDRHGHHHLREYRHTRPGRWEAHAYNHAYLPMDSERDGLTVLAFFDGVRGRRTI